MHFGFNRHNLNAPKILCDPNLMTCAAVQVIQFLLMAPTYNTKYPIE